MSENTYQVVLANDFTESENIDYVKQKMASLFKTNVSKVEKLFQHPKPVIKRSIDLETAKKYEKAINKTGACCRIEPMGASDGSAPAKSQAQAEPAASKKSAAAESSGADTGPRVAPVQLLYKGEEAYSPQESKKITAADGGLNFNIDGESPVSFDQLNALAAYTEVRQGEETDKLLLFTDRRQRPYLCNVDGITYTDFDIQTAKNPMVGFRNFLFMICRQQPGVFIEESTFDFLSGSSLHKLDPDKREKLATAMGKMLESDETIG